MLAALPAAQTLWSLHQYQIHILTWNSGIVINPVATWDDIFLHWVSISGRTKHNSGVFKFRTASLNPVSWLYFNMKIVLTRMHCLLYFQTFFSFPTWYTQPWADLNTYTKMSLSYLSVKLSFAFYPYKLWQWPVPWQGYSLVNSELWTDFSFTFSFFQSLCLLYS